MLFNLINRRTALDQSRRFFQARNGISGIGVDIIPSYYPGLTHWYKPGDLSWINPVTFQGLQWFDSLNPASGVSGSFNRSAPNRDIITLNGKNVVMCLTSQATQYVAHITANLMNQTGSYTAGFLMRQDSSTAGRTCHSFRCSVLGGCFTVGQFTQGASLNKLTYTVRSDNTQQIALNSVTNTNGIGWFIVFVTFDYTSKTLKIYEGGNTITGTNALMDNFVYTANGAYGFFQNSLTPPGGWWIGGLGEFFYYNDVKSPGIINALGNYLASEYNLTWVNV